jgi:DNA-binding NarL/FixJ family response regulator
MKPRVVIADDYRLVLSALRNELESAGFDVCGEALTGAEALESIFATEPDLALLDVHMPQGGGGELAVLLAREMPDVKVVLLTATANEDEAVEALRAGALGYLEKTISSRRLAHVLHEISMERSPSRVASCRKSRASFAARYFRLPDRWDP